MSVKPLSDAIVPFALTPLQWDALRQAYAQPVRAYHHWGHVESVLAHYAEVAAGPGWRQPCEVALAILFHDAIYEPGHRDNEARSAQLAREWIQAWWPEGQLPGPLPSGAKVDVARVEQLILLTARHGQLGPQDVDAEAALMLDCDMAILGAAQAEFEAYDRAIAEEYRDHVPGFLFRINRRRFLRGVLDQPRIFLSDWFHQRYDAQARANLRRAIA